MKNIIIIFLMFLILLPLSLSFSSSLSSMLSSSNSNTNNKTKNKKSNNKESKNEEQDNEEQDNEEQDNEEQDNEEQDNEESENELVDNIPENYIKCAEYGEMCPINYNNNENATMYYGADGKYKKKIYNKNDEIEPCGNNMDFIDNEGECYIDKKMYGSVIKYIINNFKITRTDHKEDYKGEGSIKRNQNNVELKYSSGARYSEFIFSSKSINDIKLNINWILKASNKEPWHRYFYKLYVWKNEWNNEVETLFFQNKDNNKSFRDSERKGKFSINLSEGEKWGIRIRSDYYDSVEGTLKLEFDDIQLK